MIKQSGQVLDNLGTVLINTVRRRYFEAVALLDRRDGFEA